MTDTRHADLLDELDKAGWLVGEWHQRQHRTHTALEFGKHGGAVISVHAVPDTPGYTRVRKVVKPHPTEPGQKIWALVREEVPTVKGKGYELRLRVGDHVDLQRVDNAPVAPATMQRWRDGLSLTLRQHFLSSPKLSSKR